MTNCEHQFKSWCCAKDLKDPLSNVILFCEKNCGAEKEVSLEEYNFPAYKREKEKRGAREIYRRGEKRKGKRACPGKNKRAYNKPK